MKIKVIKEFRDKTKNKKLTTVDTVLIVSTSRGKELIEKGFAVEEK